MYKKSFFITKPIWNNIFSFNKRINKKLFVPSLKKISNFDEIKLQTNKNKIAFEEFDINWVLKTCLGLKNFYEILWKNKKIYLFDNHNHAFYFWCLVKYQNIIKNNLVLFHIDEHSDMRKPKKYLNKIENNYLQKVFNYTNFELNVWDYIVPAIKSWLIDEIVQIRSESEIINSEEKLKSIKNKSIILNLDLDFFRPELDFIEYKIKKKIILKIASKAKVITVATSPFFINQNLAINVFKDLFK